MVVCSNFAEYTLNFEHLDFFREEMMKRIAPCQCRSFAMPVLVACSIVAWSVIGCGGGSSQKTTAPVSGKVTHDGEPVTEGSLIFAPTGSGPTPGKTGRAEIQSDGTYSVSTYGKDDGAVIGTHEVSYSVPSSMGHDAQGAESAEGEGVSSQVLVPKTKEVEVKSGGNTINIELVESQEQD